ncbi:response regulator transcription factor [Burkholderia ubonensis]|uniref:response regulator transcription factor n=1 Tax=Burkholderia ubonensis TaxID=101571 RepID=UPI0007C824C6|nr:response regulator transcription factor [Burkholderia ubonensis]
MCTDSTRPVNIVLADDHPAVIRGLCSDLGALPLVSVVGEAKNSTELVELLERHPCDILITDYAMPGGKFGDGLSLLEFLRRRYPDVVVIVYTAIDNPALHAFLLQCGVHSVINKIDPPAKIIHTVHDICTQAAADQVSHASPFPSHGSAENNVPNIPAIPAKLTRLEAEVVRLYVSGMSINEIAELRNRTKQTISAQKESAKRKLNITRDIDLIRYLSETGFAILSDFAISTELPPFDPQ